MKQNTELSSILEARDSIVREFYVLENVNYLQNVHKDKNFRKYMGSLIEKCRRYDARTTKDTKDSISFIEAYAFFLHWESVFTLYDCGIINGRSGFFEVSQETLNGTFEEFKELINLNEKTLSLCSRYEKLEKYNNNIDIAVQMKRHKETANDALGVVYFLRKEYALSIKYHVDANTLGGLGNAMWVALNIEECLDVDFAKQCADIFLEKPILKGFRNIEGDYLTKLWNCEILAEYLCDQNEYEEALRYLENPKLEECVKFASNTPFIEKYEYLVDLCRNKIKERESQQKHTYTLDNCGIKAININRMSNDVKALITSSVSLYEMLVNNKDSYPMITDYSVVSISALKACESVLYDVFGVRYLSFLNNKYLSNPDSFDFEQLPKEYVHKADGVRKPRHTVDRFELGKASKCAIINFFGNYSVNPYFKEFCDYSGLNLQSEDIINYFTKFRNVIALRNKAAHRNVFALTDAEECKDILFDTYAFIDKTYDMFGSLLDPNPSQTLN